MRPEIKVSVIVCAYNGQRFLPRCLDSVFQQTLQDIEIIMVDDGSTDQTLSIMQAYQEKYTGSYGDRITILSQANAGTSIARRNGVLAAKGEYIGFVDCDDTVAANRFEKMYACGKKVRADIVQSRIRGFASAYDNHLHTGKKLKKAEDVLKSYFSFPLSSPMLWQQIQKRALYNMDTFPNWHELHEDEFVYPYLLLHAKTVYFLNEPLYFYNTTNMQGTMGQVYMDKNRHYRQVVSMLRACLRVETFLKNNKRYRTYQKEFLYYKARRFIRFMYVSIISGNLRLSKIRQALAFPKQ